MKSDTYTLIYAAVMSVACALLLTAGGRLTASYREANEQAERKHKILEVLGVPMKEGAGAHEVVEIYNRSVRTAQRGSLTTYEYVAPQTGEVQTVAVPFSGPGLWGRIDGFLALAPDLRTIRGVTFTRQEETPGLGGEIESDAFRKQFVGKSVLGPDGKPGIRIVRGGGATGPNAVDAITSATMTCEKVQSMLNAAVEKVQGEVRHEH